MAEIGRPSKYDPKFVDMLIEYFDVPPYTTKEVENSKGIVQEIIIAADFPTKEGFARKIGVHRDTLKEWSNAKNPDNTLKYPEFSAAYKKAEMYQYDIMIQNGLKGGYTPNFAIFTSKNVLGMRDKFEIDADVTTKHKELTDEELDKLIEEKQKLLEGSE